MDQKLPDDWEEKVANFHQFVLRRKEELGIQGDRVFNMDEVPMSFDAPFPELLMQPELKLFLFTVVLACSESGKKLKPMVIFKRKTMPKENLLDGVVVHCHKKGWMDRDGMAVWGEKVWRARPVSFFNRTSLLIFDSFSAHIDEGIRNNYRTEHKTTTAVIPGGLTKKLQPLDISVNHSFKNHVHEEWEKWMSEGIHTFTVTGKMRRATHAEVCNWVVQAWKAVKVLSIKNGFRKAGITSGTDDDASQTSDISDNEQITSTAILDPVLDAQSMNLFNSDIEDEDFNGF